MSLQSTARSDTRSSTPPACVRPCPCSSPLLTSWTRTPCSKTTAARSAPPPRPRRPPPSASRDAKDGTKSPGPDALHRPVALRSSVRHARCTRSHRCTPGAAGARRCGRAVWHRQLAARTPFFLNGRDFNSTNFIRKGGLQYTSTPGMPSIASCAPQHCQPTSGAARLAWVCARFCERSFVRSPSPRHRIRDPSSLGPIPVRAGGTARESRLHEAESALTGALLLRVRTETLA